MRFKRKFLGPPYKEARRQGDSFFMLSAYFLPLHTTAWEHGALGLLPHLVMEKARSGEIPATAYFQNYCSVGRSPSCFTTIERSSRYFQLNSTPSRDSETVNAPWIVNVTLMTMSQEVLIICFDKFLDGRENSSWENHGRLHGGEINPTGLWWVFILWAWKGWKGHVTEFHSEGTNPCPWVTVMVWGSG